MNLREIRFTIQEKIRHLYDSEESAAIAKAYIEDKLKHALPKDTASGDPVNLPAFFEEDLQALTQGTPLQYVTGCQHFSGLVFRVNQAVLIPRPETEEMVDWILKELKDRRGEVKIIDIGTGSGCIPVALKYKNPSIGVTATDISEAALELAEENARIHKVVIRFIEDDIFQTRIPAEEKFDLIISNPPYIPASQASSLSDNVLKFEPAIALFSPDDDPILYYKAIADFARSRLKTDGNLYFEIHPDFANQIAEYLEVNGFADIFFKHDLSGHLRYIRATPVATK